MRAEIACLTVPSEITPGADVLVLIDDWRTHLALLVDTGELSSNTKDAYDRGWGKFQSWLFEQEDAYQVDTDIIRGWIKHLREKGFRPNTINAWLAGVRSFFSWAVGNRRLLYNPTEGVKSARRTRTSKRHLRDALTNIEVLAVLAVPDRTRLAGKRDYAILALKAYTGARDVELHRADLADLRTDGGQMVLDVRGKGAGSKDDFIVVSNPDAESAVHTWIAVRGSEPGALFTSISNRSKDGRLSLRSFRRIVKNAYSKAGVIGERKTSHSLRHTAITNAIRHGAPIQKVQSMARHANIETTMIYFHEVDRVTDPAEGYIRYDEREQ